MPTPDHNTNAPADFTLHIPKGHDGLTLRVRVGEEGLVVDLAMDPPVQPDYPDFEPG